ncbi:DNA primase family protein [Intestinimonas sp. MSJ-38]|uniref:DNA primase family protein n=1 Tax=Intestinimonas sp. MSJ-38 TaxID=2841532 RepID=UPI001C1203EA|nr:DNA primase [Intestinimonas sp. MSJ-38]
MITLEQAANIICSGFVEGGNGGKDGKPNFKAPFLNHKPQPWDKAQKYRWICGILPEHIIMVDYDDAAAFDCRLRMAKALNQYCIAVKSPNKGGHFYWFNSARQPVKNNSGNKTVLTLHPVDYKSGIKQIASTGEIKAAKCATSLSKEDGTLREVVYANIKEDKTLDEIPFYDLPLKSGSKHNFLNIGEGDGRQDGLFTYMNPMKAAGYSYEQFKEAAKLIEQFLFSVPLGDEFENAVRREAWDSVNAIDSSKFYSSKGQFLHNKFGDYLIEKYHIKRINGSIHVYQDGIYLPGYEPIEKIMLKELDNLTRTKRNEVLDYIRIKAADAQPAAPVLIAFKNGLFNVELNELLEFTPNQAITNLIPWEYNPGATSPLVDDVLNRLSCNDSQIRALLEEVGGMCLYRDNTIGSGKAAILVGEKSNGKSTFIFMLQSMLGDANVSNLDFKELDGKFSTYMLFGKLANLGDDISDSYKEDVATFKKIVTGDIVKAEEKGKPPFNFRPYVKLIFSANSIPRMNDSTGAALRRLLIIPLNAHFSETDSGYDPQIRYKLTEPEAVQYFINLSLEGLRRVLKQKKFTMPTRVQEEKDNYERENNPVLSFIEECRNDAGEIEGIYNEPTKEVFKRYEVFCSENGFRPMSNLTFSKRLNQALGTIVKPLRFNGKQQKAFVKP